MMYARLGGRTEGVDRSVLDEELMLGGGGSPVYIPWKRTEWRAIPRSQRPTVCCLLGGAWLWNQVG